MQRRQSTVFVLLVTLVQLVETKRLNVLMIAMDEETLKKHVDALSTDGTVANHFKTKLGLQLSLAPSNKLLDSISEEEAEKETAFLDIT